MPLDAYIRDPDSDLGAPVKKKGEDVGLAVLTEPLHDSIFITRALTNETFGADMNQAIAFTGSPELIHDGGDNAGWTGAIVTGTWDFADAVNPQADTNCVSLTSANDNDTATFTDGGEIDMGTHEAVTGQIRLETYNEVNNSITLQFVNNNVDVGNSVNLNDFIDTGVLGSYQRFVISKAAFGITTQTVDEIEMTCTRSGGTRPTFRFDVFQIEDDGSPAVFSFAPTVNQILTLHHMKITMTDGVTATSSYDKFFGVNALSSGIAVSVTSFGEDIFTLSAKRLIDFVQGPLAVFDDRIGAADSWMTININFPPSTLLIGSDGDGISFTINDDLSALAYFRVIATMSEHKDR